MTKDWASLRDEIHEHYYRLNKPLAEVMNLMRDRHDFIASERAYRTQLQKWGFHKYSTENTSWAPRPTFSLAPSHGAGSNASHPAIPAVPAIQRDGSTQTYEPQLGSESVETARNCNGLRPLTSGFSLPETAAATPAPQRVRVPVACERCRKRKIKCGGEEGPGAGCSNCRNAGLTGCQFRRVACLSIGPEMGHERTHIQQLSQLRGPAPLNRILDPLEGGWHDEGARAGNIPASSRYPYTSDANKAAGNGDPQVDTASGRQLFTESYAALATTALNEARNGSGVVGEGIQAQRAFMADILKACLARDVTVDPTCYDGLLDM